MPETTLAGPVGYLVNRPDGPEGTQGPAFDYVLASNGLFVQAQNDLVTARIRIAAAEVRGLAPADEKLELSHGTIPAQLLRQGMDWLRQTPDRERFFAIARDSNGYRLEIPIQSGAAGAVRYRPVSAAVAEIHSHGRHPAFFSLTDDEDEQGLRVYGVLGHLNWPQPQLALRIGIYGYFRALKWEYICDQPLPHVIQELQA